LRKSFVRKVTDVCAVITNVLIATSKQLGVDASRQIHASREEMGSNFAPC